MGICREKRGRAITKTQVKGKQKIMYNIGSYIIEWAHAAAEGEFSESVWRWVVVGDGREDWETV